MTDEPFGRQGKPVTITMTGGDPEDRHEWLGKIFRYLSNQPCDINWLNQLDTIHIYPDAVND